MLGEAHDAHDFMGNEHITYEGTAYICSFLRKCSQSFIRTLTGLFIVDNDVESRINISGVDVTDITPKNCCIGPDSTVFLIRLFDYKTQNTAKIQALSSGSDVLSLVGKHIDFSADETMFGASAQNFVKSLFPAVLDSVEPDQQDSILAWHGPMKLAGFKLDTLDGEELNLAT
jgi:hypothetical protein